MARKPAMPAKYQYLLTGERGEDFNDTIDDLITFVKKALKLETADELREALQAILAVCDACGTDPVE